MDGTLVKWLCEETRIHSRGHGFESQHQIWDGHFSHHIVAKNAMFARKDQNLKKLKRGRGWPTLDNLKCDLQTPDEQDNPSLGQSPAQRSPLVTRCRYF